MNQLEVKEVLAHVALALILFSVFFISLVPSILFIRYFKSPGSDNIAMFILEVFIYLMIFLFISSASLMIIPALIFRIFNLAPCEGKYELKVTNKEVFKWILSQGLYKIAMVIGRISALSKRFVNQLFGAKIGRGVIFQGDVTDPYFLEVGEYSIIGGNAKIFTHIADNPKRVLFKKVRIGKYCLIGYNAVIMPGVVLNDYVIVGANALVPKDRVLDRGVWAGIPAKKIKDYLPNIALLEPTLNIVNNLTTTPGDSLEDN